MNYKVLSALQNKRKSLLYQQTTDFNFYKLITRRSEVQILFPLPKQYQGFQALGLEPFFLL